MSEHIAESLEKRRVTRGRFTKQQKCVQQLIVELPEDESSKEYRKTVLAISHAFEDLREIYNMLESFQADIDYHPGRDSYWSTLDSTRQKEEEDKESKYKMIFFHLSSEVEDLKKTKCDADEASRSDSGESGSAITIHEISRTITTGLKEAFQGMNFGVSPEQLNLLLTTSSSKRRQISVPKFTGDEEMFEMWAGMVGKELEKPGWTGEEEKAYFIFSCLDGVPKKKCLGLKNPKSGDILKYLEAEYGNVELKIEKAIARIAELRPITYIVEDIDNMYTELLAQWNYIIQKHPDPERLKKESWILTALAKPKLPEEIIREWETTKKRRLVAEEEQLLQKFPEDFEKFLADLYDAYEIAIKTKKLRQVQEKKIDDLGSRKPAPFRFKPTGQALTSDLQMRKTCIFCGKAHDSKMCMSAPKMNHQEKYACIMRHEACLNCLEQSSHYSSACTKPPQCRLCQRKHHTLLHMTSGKPAERIPTNATDLESDGFIGPDTLPEEISEKPSAENAEATPESASTEDEISGVQGIHLVRCASSPAAILQSAVVMTESKNGKMPARILFDQGSGTSLIKKSLAKKLGLHGKPTSCTFTLVGGKTFSQTSMKVKFLISTIIPEWIGDTFEIEAYVIDEPCSDLRAVSCDISTMPHLKNLQLTEKFPHGSLPVEIILGIEDAMTVLLPQRVDGPPGLPGAQLSHIGWVVFGSYPRNQEKENVQHSLFVRVQEDTAMLERFWELDSLGIAPEETKSSKWDFLEEEAMRQHRDSIRNIGGRYETCLITHPDFVGKIVPDNQRQAERRFLNMEKRMNTDPKLAEVVHKQISDLIDKGRAELVEEEKKPDHQTWYLPMSVVTREESTTTKHRVVFDGSAKNKDGISLNDTLLPGPATQPDMLAIWLRFRTHPVILIADIEKMFLQIKIVEKDRDRQRFLYKPMNQKDSRTYRLTGVTFGLAPSPFSSIQTVLDHVESERTRFPQAAQEICENIYVDDILTGGRSIEEVAELASNMKDLMKTGGFPLRKFMSNKPEAIAHLEEEDLAEFHVVNYQSKDFTSKNLGVRIHPETDKIIYSFADRIIKVTGDETRRTLVRQLMRIHDILGLLAPVTVRGKQLLQRSFLEKSDWDDSLSSDLALAWTKWKDEIGTMEIQVDRCVFTEFTEANIEIHGFSDACPSAYGAAIYVKVTDRQSGETRVSLLTAKTRVSPLKTKRSLPELELMGAFILVRLVAFVMNSLYRIKIDHVYCWTDSQIVLHWISQPAHCWTTFVANRVAEIQKLSQPAWWKFVPGKLNPADLCSRGCSVQKLKSDQLWWNGPEFLHSTQAEWPIQPEIADNTLKSAETKRKKTAFPVLVQNVDQNPMNNYPEQFEKYHRFLSVMVLCRKWPRMHRARKRAEPIPADLVGVKQFREEEKFWIQWAQKCAYGEELACARDNKPISDKSRLANLNPILDNRGMLRVGGRANLAPMPDQLRHPIILPAHNSFIEKIIMDYHLAHSHSGTAQTWANMQHRFWIVRGKQEVKRVIRKCLKCRSKKLMVQKMSQLPTDRITPAECFSKIGVDFAGPLYVVEGDQSVKVWICLFVDMVARGLHLELCREPSAKGFLMALERMANRRGRPSLIVSDNAKAFRKAHSFLVSLFRNKEANKELMDQLKLKSIEWRFITEHAPWHGGFYERFVQSVKVPLRKILGNAKLTYTELDTALTAVEAQVNSRPLTAVSSDKEDNLPLTPAHLMTGRNLLLLPELEKDDKTDFGKKWRIRQAINQKWWNRWLKEYFPRLKTFPKWINERDNPKKGQLVHVLDTRVSKSHWKLGKIVELHRGRDDLIRSVTVLTNGKLLKRPVQKLALLELDV